MLGGGEESGGGGEGRSRRKCKKKRGFPVHEIAQQWGLFDLFLPSPNIDFVQEPSLRVVILKFKLEFVAEEGGETEKVGVFPITIYGRRTSNRILQFDPTDQSETDWQKVNGWSCGISKQSVEVQCFRTSEAFFFISRSIEKTVERIK